MNDESSTSGSYSSDWDSDVYSTDAEYNAGSRSATVVTSATDARPPAEVGSAERVHDDGSMFDDDNGNDNDDDQTMFDDDESMFDDNASTGGNVADNNESDNESNATVDDNDSPATAENIEDDNGDESARTVDEDNIARTASILNRGANDDDLHVPKELLEDFCCPISLMTMTDPVIAADGFCYDRSSIKKWMRQHDFSPMSGKPLSSYEVTTNYHLQTWSTGAHALPTPYSSAGRRPYEGVWAVRRWKMREASAEVPLLMNAIIAKAQLLRMRKVVVMKSICTRQV